MAFLGEGKPYIINPPLTQTERETIKDSYLLKIEFKNSDWSNLPQVYETSTRIERIARDRKLELPDLHINKTGTVCLCIQPEEEINLPAGFNLEDFFNNLLIPFFYAQSYFEKYNSWPWGQYGHGICGLIEWYLKKIDISKSEIEDFLENLKKKNVGWEKTKVSLHPKVKIKGHHLCICGRERKYRDCHPEVLHGLWKLKKDIIDYQIKI